jgi:hypothetical protein
MSNNFEEGQGSQRAVVPVMMTMKRQSNVRLSEDFWSSINADSILVESLLFKRRPCLLLGAIFVGQFIISTQLAFRTQ